MGVKFYKVSLNIKGEGLEIFEQIFTIWIAILQTLIVKILSYLFNWGVFRINKWVNYDKQSAYNSGLITKIILFEFFNNFTSLFYIAFIKVTYL